MAVVMKRLQLLLGVLAAGLVAAQQDSLDLTDRQCTQYFRNNTYTDSPWLWTASIPNFNYGLFFRLHPELANSSLPADEQNITQVLQAASAPTPVRPNQISYPLAVDYRSVMAVCGSSSGLYEWALVSDTLTTWILPIFGLIVSMPWESNRRGHTIYMIFRWVGQPFATLTYIFWNLRVMGRAATLVDLGVPLRPHSIGKRKRRPSKRKIVDEDDEDEEAIELDAVEQGQGQGPAGGDGNSNPDQDIPDDDPDPDDQIFCDVRDSFSILCVMNQYKLSSSLPISESTLRKNIITALFLTDATSGKFHLDATRRSVAAEIRRLRKRGVVPILVSLGWYFISLAISMYKAFGDVGDNATAHNLALGLLLGWLPVLVSAAIVDRNGVDGEYVGDLLNKLMRRVHPHDTTFTKFVGQGRRRWHFGVAHPILAMLERQPQQRYTRPVDWHAVAIETLREDWESASLADYRITYFNKWEFVHMLAAWLTLGLSVLGAWYISYNTPTVGLGCRSFSYVMFLSVCTLGGLIELALYPVVYRPVKRRRTGDFAQTDGWRGYIASKRFRSRMSGVLTALDVLATLVLFTAVFMQTTGAFQFYWCKASLVGSHGGYIVFDTVSYIKRFFDARMYWMVGTVVSSVVPVVGTVWTMREWLTQAFVWSTDVDSARRGLRRVRVWKGFWWGLRWGGRLNVKWLKGGAGYVADFGDYVPAELDYLLRESEEAYKNRPLRPDYPEKTVPEGWPGQLPPSPMLWDAETFPTDGSHELRLSEEDVAEIDEALKVVEEQSLPPPAINKATFPLPRLGLRLDTACHSVHYGLGIVFVRGIPTRKYTDEQNVLVLLGISSYFGETRGRQRNDGARLIHIFHAASRNLPETLSAIFNNHAQVFHQDIATDLLAMYCRSAAASGGASSFASFPRIYNHLAAHHPEMIHTLAAPDWPFDRYGYNPPFLTRPLLFYQPGDDTNSDNGINKNNEHSARLFTSLSPRLLSGSRIHPRPTDIPPLTQPQQAALTAIESLARKFSVTTTLGAGDLVFLNNLTVLHSRAAYQDSPALPASLHRHLMRLFLRNEDLAYPTPRELWLDWAHVFSDTDADEVWVADNVRDYRSQLRRGPDTHNHGNTTTTNAGEGGKNADARRPNIHSRQNPQPNRPVPSARTPTSPSIPSLPSAFRNNSCVIAHRSSPRPASAGHSTPTPSPPRVASVSSTATFFASSTGPPGLSIEKAQPPPPAPVSFVQPMPLPSTICLTRSSFGWLTPRLTSSPWLILTSSPSLVRWLSSGRKCLLSNSIIASAVTLSIASSINPHVVGCAFRNPCTAPTKSAVRRGWFVLTSISGSSGKCSSRLTSGGLE
ncbi:hypothetical protein Dda_2053 [Drechslerella dactyloides]|uniref:TauD/TfdA-like domain-containing protein n=1 Tax=Drechslerella dactyloides TaxID=74499 RepID=A0AAD6J2T2_DREDA|nr:hypothetical protein Dda_2053 [Drechslerella dactyloides]